MSWSKETTGPVSAILAAVTLWPTEVAAADAASRVSTATAQLHHAQVNRVVESVERFTVDVASGYHIRVEANGHGYVDTTGKVQSNQWSAHLSAYLALPVTS